MALTPDIEDLEDRADSCHGCQHSRPCMQVTYDKDNGARYIKLSAEDVQCLRSDLDSDLNGLGGSLQRSLSVHCCQHGELREALFFAEVKHKTNV